MIVWTPEMDAALIEARAQGLGYEATGEVIGVANRVVKRRVKQLGLPTWGRGGGKRGTKWTPEMEKTMRDMLDEGYRQYEISERLSVSPSTVSLKAAR